MSTSPTFLQLKDPIVDPNTGILTRSMIMKFNEWEQKLNSITATGSLQIAVGSDHLALNVMSNYSNNATVDSIDNGVNATIRVYGPGGLGTTWHQFIGGVIGPELPTFAGTADYVTDFIVYMDATGVYRITTVGLDTLPDGIRFVGRVHTVNAGGGGGIAGGGHAAGGSGGRN